MKIVACLGTNCTGEKEFTAAVDDVCRRLSGESGYICSCIYPSADADFPVGADARYSLNAVFEFETDMDIAGLHGLCKSIELEYGRDMTSRLHNRVPLDIDIVIADGEILRPRDYAQEYFQSGYTEIISGSGS